MNFFPLRVFVWRDVTRGNHMHQSYIPPGLAAAAVPAIAATTGEYSSDEILVERIAAGDKLAMQVLFARHRTNIYRWLLRFVGNETVADSADDPEIALQKKSRSELLRQAVIKLSPDHREIIDLIYYHEKSVEEVAQIVGIPEATVKTRMFYARKRMAELLKQQGVDRGWP